MVAPLKNFSEYDSRTRTRLYEDISELCHLINGTEEAKNKEYSVPRYNGGLFDPERFPDLEKWRVCDAVLADLKDFHGIDARSLTPKTKLDEFWKLKAADVFGHLRANAKTLAAQNVRLKDTDEEKIRARLQKATDKLLPLDTQITFTDSLIDQIVYRLYGLSSEEIRIVEGIAEK